MDDTNLKNQVDQIQKDLANLQTTFNKNNFSNLYIFQTPVTFRRAVNFQTIPVGTSVSSYPTDNTPVAGSKGRIQIALADGSTEFIPYYDSGASTSTGSRVLAISTSSPSNSGTGEKTILSFTLPGNMLATHGVQIFFNHQVVPSANLIDCTFKVKYGGTTMITMALSASNTANVNEYGSFSAILISAGATNSQEASASAYCLPNSQSLNGSFSGGAISGSGSAAIDSTADQTVTITMTLSHGTMTALMPVAELL